MIARDFVFAGTDDHESGGERLPPFRDDCFGIGPPSGKAVELSFIVLLVGRIGLSFVSFSLT